jgi:hypothetical protein
MSDFWSVMMALMVIAVPLWLAWALLSWGDRRKVPRAVPKETGKR